MTTKFDIITIASIALDGNAVQSFQDGTREVEVFEPIYEQAKKSELAGYEWNFNTFVEKLSQENATPVDGRWTYQYLEPSDLLRLVNVFDEDGTAMTYAYEQQRIFTNLLNPFAKFQRNLVETDFPNYFIDLLVARLAMQAAEPLSGDTGVINRAEKTYARVYRKSKAMDTKENQAKPIIKNQSRYLSAFYGGSSGNLRFRPFGS